MGNKGQSQQQQTQTYAPNPQAAGYITDAMARAQQTSQLPFNIPQAPVAGFSPQQQQAFQEVGAAQGTAQPYFNQASNYFNQSAQAPNISQFFNPFAGAVGANLADIFGQQQQQTTGQLTQAAGGVGASRIAVGQSELAKQQGLTAGQTFAGLFQPSLNAAQQQANILQGAGYGTAALGPAAQNAAFQGAGQLLGTGGLQQQLQQAQLNAPYQQQVAQAMFPYQQSQFYGGLVGALAPGLGGTTAGFGTATPAQPSIFSQLAGAGVAGAGIYGGLNSGNKGSTPTGASYGGYSPGGGSYGSGSIGGVQYPAFRRGGSAYADGGAPDDPLSDIPVSDHPVDVSKSVIPGGSGIGQLHPIAPHIPQLNFSQPSQSQSSGPSFGDIAKSALQIGALFAKDGGRIFEHRFPQGYADGGGPTDEERALGYNYLRQGMGTVAPDSIPGGEPAPAPPNDAVVNPDQPFRMPSEQDVTDWRTGANRDAAPKIAAAQRAMGLPPQITGEPADDTPQVMAFGDTGRSPRYASQAYADDTGAGRAARAPKDAGFAGSPWAALTAAGLGMMAGTSPWAGVNIGKGGLEGIKTLEEQRAAAQKDTTIEQAAQRLEQEAKFHEDQYTKMRPFEKEHLKLMQQQERFAESKPVPGGQVFDPASGLNRTQYLQRDPKTGEWKPVAGEPLTDSNGQPVKGQPALIGDAMISGEQPPNTTGLYRMAPQVRAYLANQKFDLAKAQLDWKRAEKQIQVLNGPQMTRGYQLYNSVNSTIDEVKDLGSKLQLSGIPFLNRLELEGYIQTHGNSENGQLATRYMTAVNTLKEEFANLANGGYAPTEPAWKLADQQINGNYGMKQMHASLDEVKRLINYRMKFISESPVGPAAANRYTGAPGAAPAAVPSATTAQPQVGERKQFKQGWGKWDGTKWVPE